MSGWKGSDRRSELPTDWPKIRARVFRRDGHQCVARDPDSGVRCPEPATECDHIRPGSDHSEANLRSLCSWHHGKKSGREGGQARAAVHRRNAKRFDRTEAHPGELQARQGLGLRAA